MKRFKNIIEINLFKITGRLFWSPDKEKKSIIFIYLLFGIMLSSTSLTAKDVIVGKSGEVQSIQEAIRMAETGDRIFIPGGLYQERNIIIDKTVTIWGEDRPVIDGENQSSVFIIKANGVIIRGLVIKNAGVSYIEDNAGLLIEDARDCVIENNDFINNFFAIYLSKSSYCTISNNRIQGNATRESSSGNGIHLWYCKNITVEKNYISGHRDGIYFEFVQNGLIRDNQSEQNLRYGLHFMFSDSCKYTSNTFKKNGVGVAVMYTNRVEMTHNTFENNWGSASFGLLLKEIRDSLIRGNIFYKNSTALYSEASNRNRIEKNVFTQNGWALRLMANSMDNQIVHNIFEGNSFDVATNSRQNFNQFNENYWSNYQGYDLDGDGLGDVPYHPVKLFSFLVQKNPPGIVLLKSFFIQMLDMAENILPVITPETLVDKNPRMVRHYD
ncbi:MAG: nitrous oxide reductase family maturation protein NosD [bacterium]|nr:MAG: nitrous oxide reductase family maturation protein NosD [bacterium]